MCQFKLQNKNIPFSAKFYYEFVHIQINRTESWFTYVKNSVYGTLKGELLFLEEKFQVY